MRSLQRLSPGHAAALLRFEQENRAYFARSVPDRGDDYFTGFAARHRELLAEQATGRCQFHVMVDDDGAVLARFNLVDVASGGAELGFRVAERLAGQGVATAGVVEICALARDRYGLQRLYASTALDNFASLAVLRRTGFAPLGPVQLDGRPGLRHVRTLTAGG